VEHSILLISAMSGVENCALNLSHQLGFPVDFAIDRKESIEALKRKQYSVVVVDESIAEADTRGAEVLWRYTSLAVPMQVNFALSGTARLARDIRAALSRREQEQALAMRAAAFTIESQLKSTVTGLLLQSQLALAEPAISGNVASKLRLVVELAGNLRVQLERAQV
jgi:CheY-like chemotaxis protein